MRRGHVPRVPLAVAAAHVPQLHEITLLLLGSFHVLVQLHLQPGVAKSVQHTHKYSISKAATKIVINDFYWNKIMN